jgi:hypothetical protein
MLYWKWYPKTGILAYLESDPALKMQSITLATPGKGVISRHDVSRYKDFQGLSLSPDGQKVLFLASLDSRALAVTIRQWQVLDGTTGRITPLVCLSAWQSWFSTVMSNVVVSSPSYSTSQWAPDGKSVAIPVFGAPFATKGKFAYLRIWPK